MSVSLPDTSTIRQPSPRGGMSLGELLDESAKGHAQWCLLLEARRNGEDVERELATLNEHLDALEVEINEHPGSQRRRLEAIEERRLAR